MAVIGCGNMGGIILEGAVSRRFLPCRDILICDLRPEAVEDARRRFGAVPSDNRSASRSSGIILLSVKPAQISDVVRDIRDEIRPGTVLISIAAGVTTGALLSLLNRHDVRVVRVMPNLPIGVGRGLIAYALGPGCGQAEKRLVKRMFDPLGFVFHVPETGMDAVTAISGSGPGYLFYLAEILEGICREAGFEPSVCRRVPAMLFSGSGRMLEETGKTAQELRRMVSSPGGTTLAGLAALERGGLADLWKDAVDAARKRAAEISREISRTSLSLERSGNGATSGGRRKGRQKGRGNLR